MKKFNYLFIVLILAFAVFMLICPTDCRKAALDGVLLCGNVIIPTLFPFTFCVLFITNSKILIKLEFLNKFTMLFWGLSVEEFSIMLLSFIGGYPTGAKLIDTYSGDKNINSAKLNLMLCYCVNAGPAFIVMAVGVGVLNSQKIGWLLLASHIISSFTMALFLGTFCKKHKQETKNTKKEFPVGENFILSATSSATAVLSVCIYVILFSVINVFADFIAVYIPFFKYITPLLEVTTAVSQSRNLYHIAFLLGFSGVCVWCQILGLIKSFKVNLPYFIISRVIHGILSIFIMFLMLKIFKISIPTFSNSVIFKTDFIYGSIPLTVSLFILGILFIVSTIPINYDKLKRKI